MMILSALTLPTDGLPSHYILSKSSTGSDSTLYCINSEKSFASDMTEEGKLQSRNVLFCHPQMIQKADPTVLKSLSILPAGTHYLQ
jgi:hypothetical protein